MKEIKAEEIKKPPAFEMKKGVNPRLFSDGVILFENAIFFACFMRKITK